LKVHFNVEDDFDPRGRLKFTCNNGWKKGVKMMVKLDKVHAPNASDHLRIGSIYKYEIM
jgi:hypothetical protein